MVRRLAIGFLFLTLAAAAAVVFRAAALDGDWSRGLYRLAAQRAVANGAPIALAGLLGSVVAIAFAAVLRRLGWEGPVGARGPLGPLARGLAILSAAAVLAAGAAAVWAMRVPALSNRPSVLLVVMDTVRADRLSAYGYGRPTTPELDAFAREAIRYARFYSTSSWTLPGHASLFTGQYPVQHGATQEHLRLDRDAATLAEILRNAGYETFGASANPVVGSISGLDQGFREFRDVWRQPGDPFAAQAAHPVNAAFEDLLARTPRDRPFFAFLNYMEAHLPYQPPPALVQRVAGRRVNPLVARRVGGRKWFEHYLTGPYPERDLALLSDLYDAELARLSLALGDLLQTLRRDGRYDETLIVLTSDHGENLGEHGLVDHVFSLYETTVHVPLLLRLPGGQRGGSVDARLGQLVDLFPTLLLATHSAPLPNAGVDLLASAPGRDQVFAEYYRPDQALGMIDAESRTRHADRLAPFQRRLRAIQRDGRKLIWGSDGRHELYEVVTDPGETENRIAEVDPRPLQDALDRTLETLAPEAARRSALAAQGLGDEADRATREALRALGYVE